MPDIHKRITILQLIVGIGFYLTGTQFQSNDPGTVNWYTWALCTIGGLLVVVSLAELFVKKK